MSGRLLFWSFPRAARERHEVGRAVLCPPPNVAYRSCVLNPSVRLLFVCVAFFTISVVAADFPKHPFILVNEQELVTLRQQVSVRGWKASVYRGERDFAIAPTGAGIRKNADLWLKRRIEIPARGGHYHHFFCEQGDRLEIPPNQTFRPGPYRCPKCGKKYAGEKYEGALRCCLHHWLAVAALDLALVSQVEKKAAYAEKAAEILAKYADAYPGPHTDVLKGGMIFQSLNEAMWIIPLAQAYDLIYDNLSEPERVKIEQFLFTAAKGIQSCGARGNWHSWHLSAVGVVGYTIGNRELVDWATAEFKKQIADELGDDGLWPESVHTYHYFPLYAFISFAEAAWHAGMDLYHWEAKPGKSLLSMFKAPLHYAYPDMRLPAINDGWFQAFLPADTCELAYYRTKEPAYAWVVANGYRPGVVPAGTTNPNSTQRGGLYAFLFGEDIVAQEASPVFTSTNFPVLGICVLRSTNNVMMTFDYGPFLGHGQLDKMGITLFANGKLWAADYGTPGYGSSILPWYASTFAHNTVVIDGENQKRTKEREVKLWLGDRDFEVVRAQTKEANPGVTHSRTVMRVGDYFVVVDRLQSAQSHTYDFYFRSEGELSLHQLNRKSAPAKPPVPWIKTMTEWPAQLSVSGEWKSGRNGLAFWMTGTGSITPITATAPAESGSRKVPLFIARQTNTNAQFVSVLFPFTRRPGFIVEKTSDQEIAVRHGGFEDVLSFGSDQQCPSFSRRRFFAGAR